METATDRIVELERKLDTMSGQLDLIAEEIREQRLRRQQWDELRSDLSICPPMPHMKARNPRFCRAIFSLPSRLTVTFLVLHGRS